MVLSWVLVVMLLLFWCSLLSCMLRFEFCSLVFRLVCVIWFLMWLCIVLSVCILVFIDRLLS